MAWSSAAAVVFAVGVGVGEDGVGPVHPAAQTAASIKTANVPAKNDFFTVRLCKLLIVSWYCIARGLSIRCVMRSQPAMRAQIIRRVAAFRG
jgi:hypothetical protein